MKKLMPLLFISGLAFAAEPIKNPILTQDLAHTPRLFQCMKGLVADLNGQAFHGPFFTKSPTGKTDRSVAAYIIRAPKREKYYWYFKAPAGQEFRLFTYDYPTTGLAVGMFGPGLDRDSTVTDEVNGKEIAKIDLTPCEKFLARP